MNKILLLILCCWFLVSCKEDTIIQIIPTKYVGIQKICLEGVSYYTSSRYSISPVYTKEGKLEFCN